MVGAIGGGLCGTCNGARMCEGPRGTRGKARTEARPKIVPTGLGAKTPQGPQDEWKISLVGAAGGWPPQDSKWGKALRGASRRPRGRACRGPPKNSAYRSGGQNTTGAPRQVGYSLGEGRGEWPPRDSEWDVTLRGPSRLPGGDAYRDLPKNSACKSEDLRPQGRQYGCVIALVGGAGGGIRGTQNGENICKEPRSP